MSTLSTLSLTRMSGAGNTFFVVFSEEGTSEARADFARRACTEYVGFSTDGFLFLQKSSTHHARWDFYNSDGSPAEMCGNAARCAALFYHRKFGQSQIRFQTVAGDIEAHVIDVNAGVVRVRMPTLQKGHGAKEVLLGTRKVRGYFVNTGVPHFVIQAEPDEDLARELRRAQDFGPKGANVTFVELDETDFVQAVTFERGVEGFTLACGTGAVAAALFHHVCEPEVKTQMVEMPGGLLQVDWDHDVAFLTGPAEFHFELQLFAEPMEKSQ